ncbi:MAG: hypothetical protein AAF669_04190 [Pseudomonadota bacterium]
MPQVSGGNLPDGSRLFCQPYLLIVHVFYVFLSQLERFVFPALRRFPLFDMLILRDAQFDGISWRKCPVFKSPLKSANTLLTQFHQ